MADETAFDRIVGALEGATGMSGRRNGSGWSFRCPSHEDRNPSLAVHEIEGSVLVYCHAGCATEDVLSAVGLTKPDLYDERQAEYQYSDLAGATTRTVRRYGPDAKRFVQKVVDPNAPALYRLGRLLRAGDGGQVVYVVEGEKDVLALESIGELVVATCSAMGAGKWKPEYAEHFRGVRRAVVVADKDLSGRRHAQTVANSLAAVVGEVEVVEAKAGKDAADHVAAGYTLADFVPTDIKPVVAPRRELVATSARELKMKAPRWLYDWRIPAGAITLLGGREGIGKSTISYDFAARITRGRLAGRFLNTPKGVGVVAGEDDWECVILPRLVAAGAELDRVYRVEARTEEGRYDMVSMPADLERLTQLCGDRDIAMVIVDPIMSVIHGSLDTHKDRDVRQALDPLARFASTTGVAVLGLIHVNKSTTNDPLNSLMASRAFGAVARSVLYCLLDPEAEKEDRFLFGHPKSNLGPKQPTLRYHLVEVKVELDDPDDPLITTSRVIWDGADERSIRDAMETRPDRADSEVTVRILEWLAEQGRTVASREIAAEFTDIKRSTLDKHLGRLVERGKLTRPTHGHFALPSRSGSESGTSLETDLEPEVPELPEVQGNLAALAHLAPGRRPEDLPELLPEVVSLADSCSICGGELLLRLPGRDTCERCRLSQNGSAA